MESNPQNPEFMNNPENFHPCKPIKGYFDKYICRRIWYFIRSTLFAKNSNLKGHK